MVLVAKERTLFGDEELDNAISRRLRAGLFVNGLNFGYQGQILLPVVERGVLLQRIEAEIIMALVAIQGGKITLVPAKF